jgi:hypothetical protein
MPDVQQLDDRARGEISVDPFDARQEQGATSAQALFRLPVHVD